MSWAGLGSQSPSLSKFGLNLEFFFTESSCYTKDLPTIYPKLGGRILGSMPFPGVLSTALNANSLVQNLNDNRYATTSTQNREFDIRKAVFCFFLGVKKGKNIFLLIFREMPTFISSLSGLPNLV